jgi:FtsP/CotA-like multicopper oxidase with cupredoxin domain
VRAGRERGASLIELALVFPVMALIVFGVLDLGRGYQLHLRAEAAAREGVAFAQIHPNHVVCADGPDIVASVSAEEEGLAQRPGFDVEVLAQDDSGAWVEISGCDGDGAQPGERVRVEVTVTYDVLTPIVERVVGATIDLTGDAEARVQG